MSEEKEIKVKILDNHPIDIIKKDIENIFNVKLDRKKHQKDIYYDFSDGFYFNLNQGLRLRNNNELSYKALFFIPELKRWFVYEKNLQFPIKIKDLNELFSFANLPLIKEKEKVSLDNLKIIFEKLNLIEFMIIEKTRLEGLKEDSTFCLDILEKLGNFLEIESSSNERLKELEQKIPFNSSKVIHGYTEIYAKEILGMNPGFKIKFEENPDWNYLKDQKSAIYSLINQNP